MIRLLIHHIPWEFYEENKVQQEIKGWAGIGAQEAETQAETTESSCRLGSMILS